jgi:hypothetical protein
MGLSLPGCFFLTLLSRKTAAMSSSGRHVGSRANSMLLYALSWLHAMAERVCQPLLLRDCAFLRAEQACFKVSCRDTRWTRKPPATTRLG